LRGFGLRVVEDIGRRAAFDDPSRIHHHHLVRDRPGDGQVVRDEQVGKAQFVVEPGEQVEDLRADRHIERRDRLVADDELGSGDDGAGDSQPLSLAAGELVRIAEHGVGRHADLGQRGGDALAALGAGQRPVFQMQRFGDELFHRLARVERAIGILEDHLHLAAGGAQVAVVEQRGFHAVERHDARTWLVERQHDAGKGGLAAAGLADEPDRVARRHGEADIVDRAERRAARKKAGARAGIVPDEVLHLQQRPVLGGPGARLPGRQMRGGFGKLARIGVHLRAQHLDGGPGLLHLPVAQDGDLVGHAGDNAQIVANEHEPHAVLGDQFAQQIEDLRLQHHVERGGRLVGDQEFGPQRAGDGDDDALALSAGQFVRIAVERKACTRQADPLEHARGAGFGIGAVCACVPPDAFGHLLADRLDRVERGHRFLEDHADLVAAQRAHAGFGRGEQVFVAEPDEAGGPRAVGEEPHGRQRGHRLARSALADERMHLARLDRQIDAAQDWRAADGEIELFDREDRRAHRSRRSLGSSTSRSPSPSRLSPSTVTMIAMPGAIAICGAIAIMVCASDSIRPQLVAGG